MIGLKEGRMMLKGAFLKLKEGKCFCGK